MLTATGNSNSAVGESALQATPPAAATWRSAKTRCTTTPPAKLNTAVGQATGLNLTTGSNNIDIKNVGVAGEASTIRIGGASQTKAFLAGVSGVTTAGAAAPVLVDASGQLGTTSSSRRFKRAIRAIGGASDRLMRLRPVSFHYKRSFVHGSSPL